MKIKYMSDLFRPILTFAIAVMTALALKGGAEWSKIVCASIGAFWGEVALFAKEGYDLLEKKTFWDWNDIKNGQYGVVLGFLCAWLLM